MSLPAILTRANVGGRDQRSQTNCYLHVERPDETAILVAARWLADVRSEKAHAIERDVVVIACEIAADPRRPQTGNAGFDKMAAQSGGFISAPTISNVQLSNHIRAASQLTANGKAFAYGELRAKDLQVFDVDGKPGEGFEEMKACLAHESRIDQPFMLYKICHKEHGWRTARVHGWVLTDEHGNLSNAYPGKDLVSAAIMAQAVRAFTHATIPGTEKVLLRIEQGIVTLATPEVVAEAEVLLEAEAAGNTVTSAPRPAG